MPLTQRRLNTWAKPGVRLCIGAELLLGFSLLLPGCTAPASRRPQVSDQLEQRTGYSLGTTTAAGTFSLPPGVALDRPLTDEEVVAIALWNNAAFQQLLAELGVARADIVMAGQIANPTLMALFPLGSKQLEYLARVPVEALWLRKRRLEAAQAQSNEVAERMVQGGLNLIRDVKLACADLRLADRSVKLRQESLELLSRVAAVAESSFQAGAISGLEAATARVAMPNAEQDLLRAQADAAVARVRLRTMIGLGQDRTSLTLAATASSPKTIPRDANELLTDALANRPDLRAAELGLEAAGDRAKVSRREIYQLTVLLDGNGNGTGSGANFGPGVDLPIPIFNLNQGGIAVADARLEQAARNYVTVRDQIVLDVHQAYARWQQAVVAMDVWNERLQPELEAAVAIARRGVESGDLLPLQALEAERTLNSALLNQQLAIADWQRAVAELERAIGHRLDLPPAPAITASTTSP